MQSPTVNKLLLIVSTVSLLVLMIAAVGCGSAGSAPAPQAQTSPDSAHVTVSSAGLNFGSVAVGSQATAALTVTNSRGSKGTVTQVSVTGAGFSFTSSSNVPFSLAPGQSATLNVIFAPTVAGAASGSISVAISGGASPAPTSLTGIGLGPNQPPPNQSGQLGLSPASMNFGTVALGTSQSQTGSLTASGSSITISSASWQGTGYSVSGITFPVTVPAGQSVPFTVTFAPQTAGSSTGSVSFVSNASNSPDVETLSGSGGQQQHSVALSWSASTSSVAGYNVYRGTQSGGPYNKLTASVQPGTTYSDGSVLSGATYFYVVTAVDSSSQESVFSNEATAVIPVP